MKKAISLFSAFAFCAISLVATLEKITAEEITKEEIPVAVASNFTAPMTKLAGEFEMRTGHRLKLAYGSSGKFHAQISNGAPFELFFSADQAKPIALEESGQAIPGSRFTYAIGNLALWSSNPNAVVNEDALKHQRFNKLALATPRLAPYGAAAVEVLESLGMKDATEAKWVQGENIAQTYQFVGTGNAELGFVALSQIMENNKIKSGAAWIVPTHLYQPIRQDAVLLRPGGQSIAAREFLRFVRTSEARAVIESHGYRTDDQE